MMKRKWIGIVLTFCLLTSLAGCRPVDENPAAGSAGSGSGQTVQLGVADLPPSDLGDGFCFVGEEMDLTDVSVDVFRESYDTEGNIMISPLSLITALTMTARGAEGGTLAQMEEAFDIDLDYFTSYLGYFLGSLEDRPAKFTSANSIWIRDDAERLTVNEQFVVDAEAYFDADVFKAAFDKGTVKDINHWASEKTDGMIPQLLEEIKEDEVMHLINALCFDAKWQHPYESWNVTKGEFLNADGGTGKADFMYGEEFCYLEDNAVKGFVKPYEGGFSFVALVPKAGVLEICGYPTAEGLAEGEEPVHGETYGKYTGEFTAEALSKYVESMTGDSLRQLLDSQTEVMVKTKLPVFTSEYSVDLIPALEALGIEDLFDETAADLSGMATSSRGNIFISKVFQKTFIEVDTEGTRAAAVTDIAASDSAAMVEPDYKEVYLDRPFLYMIVDDATGVPVFMGTVTEL